MASFQLAADEPGEYDREGQMAKVQLQTIMRAAEEIYSEIEDDTNLPEWVQSKMTLAQDYLTTVKDYVLSSHAEVRMNRQMPPERE